MLKVCGHVIEAAIDLAATVLYKLLQQHGHEFRDYTQLLAKQKL